MAKQLGHEIEVVPDAPAHSNADVAIVNLSQGEKALDAVRTLGALGIKVIGHAGHKERELLEGGKVAGCELTVSNSAITHKFAEVLDGINNAR